MGDTFKPGIDLPGLLGAAVELVRALAPLDLAPEAAQRAQDLVNVLRTIPGHERLLLPMHGPKGSSGHE